VVEMGRRDYGTGKIVPSEARSNVVGDGAQVCRFAIDEISAREVL
jgi:hypothetical protein